MHHALLAAVFEQQEKGIQNLTTTIRYFTNPFHEDQSDLFNLVTKHVMPEDIKEDLCKQSEIGNRLYEVFLEERIKSDSKNLWSPMKKQKLKTWKNTAKKIKVKAGDKVTELREDQSLFARLMVVCKSRPEINLKEAIGKYEFSVVPRSMFASDGELLHCSTKSALMTILEKLPAGVLETTQEGRDNNTRDEPLSSTDIECEPWTVALVDAMAEVQSLGKHEQIRNCSDLANLFTSKIHNKYDRFDEIRLIFDRYDVANSLKTVTRVKRQGGQQAVLYHVTDTADISKISMKKLLSHTGTKKELTTYLAKRIVTKGLETGKSIVVAFGVQCIGTKKDMSHMNSDHEEADTKLLLHAMDASSCGATKIHIFSPDTDVLVLAIRRYPELCKDTVFETGIGKNHRIIELDSIVKALGPHKVAALPAFHALSGADVTGSFAGKGKVSCWKAFEGADEEILDSLASLGSREKPSEQTLAGLEKFVCQLYLPKTKISQVQDLRWWLFKKKQAQSEKLPPTPSALHEALLRAHYQLLIWNNDKVACPDLPSPLGYGWRFESGEWIPVMSAQPPAPSAVVHLVKCGCNKSKCTTNQCNCHRVGLSCTELCGCADGEGCDNVANKNSVHEPEEPDVADTDNEDEEYFM